MTLRPVLVYATLFLNLAFASACDDKNGSESAIKAAPGSSTCQNQIARKICGTHIYYKYTTWAISHVSGRKGKIDGCFYPTTREAYTDVYYTCTYGGSSGYCEPDTTWNMDTTEYTYKGSECRKDDPEDPTPKYGGYYRIPSSGIIFFVNDSNHYCKIADIPSYEALGKPSYQEIVSIPGGLSYDGFCHFPHGYYRIPSGIIFAVNEKKHYCTFPNWASYEAHGKPAYKELSAMPTHLTNDGDCK